MIAFVDSHLGLLVFSLMGLAALILYARGEAAGLFPFVAGLFSTVSPDGKSTPSVKNVVYFMGGATLCWSGVKVTLAVCRAIDAGKLDPFGTYFVIMGAVAALAGGGYLIGKKINAGSFSADGAGSATP